MSWTDKLNSTSWLSCSCILTFLSSSQSDSRRVRVQLIGMAQHLLPTSEAILLRYYTPKLKSDQTNQTYLLDDGDSDVFIWVLIWIPHCTNGSSSSGAAGVLFEVCKEVISVLFDKVLGPDGGHGLLIFAYAFILTNLGSCSPAVISEELSDFFKVVFFKISISHQKLLEAIADHDVPVRGLLHLSNPFVFELASQVLLDLVLELMQVCSWLLVLQVWSIGLAV
jgi:hypothetical protein